MVMTIEVLNNSALNILSGMERLNLIRVKVPANNAAESDRILSRLHTGRTKHSDTKSELFHQKWIVS